MGTLYKVIKETIVSYGSNANPTAKYSKTFNVGDTFVGDFYPHDTPIDKTKVYTTAGGTAPDFYVLGQQWLAIPIENVQETSLLGGDLSNSQKWAWVIGLTLAAWGLIYWSEKQGK
jgi:hypothetical protein